MLCISTFASVSGIMNSLLAYDYQSRARLAKAESRTRQNSVGSVLAYCKAVAAPIDRPHRPTLRT